MSLIDRGLAVLQSSYTEFCSFYDKQRTSEERLTGLNERAKIVSEKIGAILVCRMHPKELQHMLYIQRHWGGICLTLCKGQRHDPRADEKITKITRRLELLSTSFVSSVEACFPETSKSPAEMIRPYLSTDHCRGHFKEELSSEASQFSQSCPKALTQAKLLVERVMLGKYGPQMKEKILSPSSPLHLHTHFRKMLLVDMILRQVDPMSSCEWFTGCNKKDIQAVTESLYDLSETLSRETALSGSPVLALFFSKSTYFSPAIEERLNKILNEENYSRIRHTLVLEHLAPHFSPTNKHLMIVAHCLFSARQYKDAFEIACLIQGPVSEREQYCEGIFQEIVRVNVSLAGSLFESLRSSDRDLYHLGLRLIIERQLKDGIDIAKLCDSLLLIENYSQFPRLATKVIEKVGSAPLDTASIALFVKLLSSMRNQRHLLCLLELVVAGQNNEISREIMQKTSLEYCPFAKSAYIFAKLAVDKRVHLTPELLEYYKTIESARVRSMLIERLVIFIVQVLNRSELAAIFDRLALQLEHMTDKDQLYKVWALELNRIEGKQSKAEEIAQRISDSELKLLTLMNIQSVRPSVATDRMRNPLASLIAGLRLLSMADS